ncbi:MAG: LPS assembly protein LptD [Smithellaceae bacterium]
MSAAVFFLILAISAGQAQAQMLQVPADAPVEIEADNLAYDSEREVYTAEGNVVITYGAGVLRADYVEYNQKTSQASAQGNAHLQMDEDTLAGDRIVVNTGTKTGVAYNSKAFYARNHLYVSGDRIEKTGEHTYVIDEPVATTCDGENPDWELAGSRMKVTIDGYGWVKNARFRAAGIPVIYTPVLAFPAKTTRQSGFLFPYLSYSRDKEGVDIEVPFFWAISPHLDATLYQRYIEKRGYKQGLEFRYWAGTHSYGTFYGDYLEDRKNISESGTTATSRDWQEMHKRWSYYLNHQTQFDSRFYLRTDLRRVSDAWYFRDFNSHNYYLQHFSQNEQDPFKKVPFRGDESLRSLDSTVRLSKGWEHVSLTALVRSTDDFSAINNDRTLQQYPEISIMGMRRPLLSTPLYFEFAGAYDYFYRKEGQRGHYVNIAPAVSLPFALGPYAKVTPRMAVYETFWRRDDDDNTQPENKQGVRSVYNASLTVSSQISRVFDASLWDWEKIRHEIKPEIQYSYIPYVEQDDIPDYLPKIAPAITPLQDTATNALMEQNAVAWSLTNTLTAKTKQVEGTNHYLEFLRLKLFQSYDIREARRDMAQNDRDRRPIADLGLEFDFKPHRYLSFAARNKYSVYTGWKQTNYDLSISDWRQDKITLGYRYTMDSIEEINLDIKAVINKYLDAKVILRQDLFNNRDVEKTVGLTYTEQCWSVGVDYTRTWDDERVMLRFSLVGLGAFGI